jgi:23S rRNA (cytidine1920-2'-O)/16S rRNA (cytidine1409-2'-O)-methyltransferase
LDLALVSRGLARSRNQAASLIEQGLVRVNGKLAQKPSQIVTETASLEVLGEIYVARSAEKLLFALDHFNVSVPDHCLDIGASTGGFTQVLLQRGAKSVVALDVGREQLASELRSDPRVIDLSGRNIREVAASELANSQQVGLVVVDLSFISLKLVADKFLELAPNAQFIVLIKPQFELQKSMLNDQGIVDSAANRQAGVKSALSALAGAGLKLLGLCLSPITGTHGNIEYLAHLAKGEPGDWEQFVTSLS